MQRTDGWLDHGRARGGRLTDDVVVMYNHFDRTECLRLVMETADLQAFTSFSDQQWWVHMFMWCWLATAVLAVCFFAVVPAVLHVARRVSGTYGYRCLPCADDAPEKNGGVARG
jgi:hypothetical protein